MTRVQKKHMGKQYDFRQSLRFVIADCKEAINTNPKTPKADQYADEILYCLRELHRRDIVSENTAFVMNNAKEIN